MPETEEIERQVLEILVEELGADTPTLTGDLMKDYGADSLDSVEIVMAVERQFDMDIPDADVEEAWRTGQDIVDYLVRRGQAVTHGLAPPVLLLAPRPSLGSLSGPRGDGPRPP
jgi:acyl carrier protein